MGFGCTSIIGVDARLQFVGAEHAVGLRNRTLAMHPLGLDWVEPRALAGQQARHDPHALAGLFEAAIMDANPVAHILALVPGGIVPDQEPATHALGRQPLTTPCQKVSGHRAEWAPFYKAQQHLVSLLWPAAKQHPITGQ